MLTRVLVPLDGSDISEAIIPYVTELANRMNAGIVLQTVVEQDWIDSVMLGMSMGGSGDQQPDDETEEDDTRVTRLEADALREAEDHLKIVSDRISAQGIEVNVVASVGEPAEQIIAVAEAEGCDLIAMATHGRNVVLRGLLGSVTDRVLHSSTTPVLTISPDEAAKQAGGQGPIRNVVVPLDGSELAESVLPWVEALARTMAIDVHLIRAFDPAAVDRRSRYLLALADVPTLSETVGNRIQEYLDSVASRLREKGLEIRTKVLRGPVASSILSYAENSPLDIIVMSTHGRTGFRRLLLGSVTEAVVRSSSDPVMIVPPQTS